MVLFRENSLFFIHFYMGRNFEIFYMGRYFSHKADSNTFPMHIRNWKSVHWRLRYDFLNMTMFCKNPIFRPFWTSTGLDLRPFLKNLSMQKLFFMVIEQILKISLELKNFFFSVALFKKIDPFTNVFFQKFCFEI